MRDYPRETARTLAGSAGGIVGHVHHTDPMLDVKAVAKRLSVSTRTVQRLAAEGNMPQKVYIRKRVVWRRDEIDEWIRCGCPKGGAQGGGR